MDMVMVSDQQLADDYALVEKAIGFLEGHFRNQPSLREVAESAGMSEYHFQRLFTRWVGISPKRFLQYLTKEYAEARLLQSEDLLNVTYDSGLSSPGRLHDLFVTHEAVTPGEFKSGGEGVEIRYGFHPTPFGECLLARTSRGICHLAFVEGGLRDRALSRLRGEWPHATRIEDPGGSRAIARQIFAHPPDRPGVIPLLLNGTNFQVKVWEALLGIPSGSVVTYRDIAVSIGMPGASRAVGSAVARNPIAVLIPCHRVIRKDGDFGNYHYGSARKKALLGWEFAQHEVANQRSGE